MKVIKTLLFWSGGKNSALALTRLKSNPEIKIIGLVTLLDRKMNAVTHHGIPEALIVGQAKLLNIPTIRIYQDSNTPIEENLENIVSKITPFIKSGIEQIAFGDVNVNESIEFKNEICKRTKTTALFPLWGAENISLLNEFFSTNHHAIVTAINKQKLDNSFLAKEFNQEWVNRLPDEINPFGINGEFHTFTTFTPHFKMRIPYSKAIAIDDGPYTITTLKEP